MAFIAMLYYPNVIITKNEDTIMQSELLLGFLKKQEINYQKMR